MFILILQKFSFVKTLRYKYLYNKTVNALIFLVTLFRKSLERFSSSLNTFEIISLVNRDWLSALLGRIGSFNFKVSYSSLRKTHMRALKTKKNVVLAFTYIIISFWNCHEMRILKYKRKIVTKYYFLIYEWLKLRLENILTKIYCILNFIFRQFFIAFREINGCKIKYIPWTKDSMTIISSDMSLINSTTDCNFNKIILHLL